MPTIVLPQQQSQNSLAAAGVGIGQALGGISELMFALEQRREFKRKEELVEAAGALKLFGDDPNAAPVEVQQQLLDAYGVKGVVKDPITGKYAFPRSAMADLQTSKATYLGQIYTKALKGDPNAMRDARVAEGLEQPAPSEFEQTYKYDELALREKKMANDKARSWISANAKVVAARMARQTEMLKQDAMDAREFAKQTDITNREKLKQDAATERTRIRRGALDKESGLFGVAGSGRLFQRPSDAMTYADSVGLDYTDPRVVVPLTNEEASMTMTSIAEQLDIEKKDIDNRKLNIELKKIMEYGPVKEAREQALKFAKEGDDAAAALVTKAMTGVVIRDLVKTGVDPRAIGDLETGFWTNDPELEEMLDPQTIQFLAEEARKLPPVDDEEDDIDDNMSASAIGFDTQTGQAMFPAGEDPAFPKETAKSPEENPLNMLKAAIREQFRVGAEQMMPKEAVRTQMLIQAQQVYPTATFEMLKAIVDSAMHEAETEAIIGVK